MEKLGINHIGKKRRAQNWAMIWLKKVINSNKKTHVYYTTYYKSIVFTHKYNTTTSPSVSNPDTNLNQSVIR